MAPSMPRRSSDLGEPLRPLDWRLGPLQELRVPVERALHWIDKYGDVAGDGYVSYLGNTNKGLINQGGRIQAMPW